MKSNLIPISKMMFNKSIINTFYTLDKKFKKNKKYKFINMIKGGGNAIKNERLVIHEGKLVVNSFLPPINSEAYNTIAMAVPGEDEEFFDNHVNGKRNAPISTYIAITSRCMYKCWHCSAKRFIVGEENYKEELSTEDLKKIVSDLQNLGVGIIGFTGGEPLLRKDLEEIIEAVDERSVTLLFTNGYKLNLDKAQRLKKSGLFAVGISLDSIDSEIHDSKRGFKGAFENSINAIENCKKTGLYTMVQTVCTREMLNSKEIYEIAAYLKKLGVDELRVLEPIPCGELLEKNEAILSLSEKEELKKLHIIFNNNKKYVKTSVFPYLESKQQFGCGAGVQHSYIDNKGNFTPCDFVSESFGNVLNEDIKDIWSKMHQKIGKPKCYCYAKKCDKCESLERPKYYELLAGKKDK